MMFYGFPHVLICNVYGFDRVMVWYLVVDMWFSFASQDLNFDMLFVINPPGYDFSSMLLGLVIVIMLWLSQMSLCVNLM